MRDTSVAVRQARYDGEAMRLVFGDFELDAATGAFRRHGKMIPMQPRVFDTLRYLIEHRDHVVGKQELLDALWGGESTNAVAVPWSVSHARRALGQRGGAGGPIETVRGRGYRFVAEVRHSEGSPPASPGGRHAPTTSTSRGVEPFLGREQIMGRLTDALNEARGGRGRLVLLTGEAGIGKTRCASELANVARNSGLGVWVGRSVAGGGAPAFWPWIQILRAACADRRVTAPERASMERVLTRLLPRNLPAEERSRSAAPLHSDASRFWLSEELVRLLRVSAERKVRVVFIDDLHAADAGSLEALALLAPELAQVKMLVVATVRDGASTAVAPDAAPARLRPCETLVLAGLTFEDTERYISGELQEPAPRELARAVYARTAGNPLFLQEAVRLIAARVARGERLRPGDVPLPEVARQLVHDRIGTMDAPTREILNAACVIGEDFELSVLQRVVSLPAETVLGHLEAAARGRFVQARADGESYAFAHALIREALLEMLPAIARKRLHARVARALESFAVVRPRVGAIAYHLHHALPEENALEVARYGRLAGDSAMQVFAYDEAARFYSWALEAHLHAAAHADLHAEGALDARSACELLLSSARAERLAGRVRPARDLCRQAVGIAQRENFAELLVDAARSLRTTVWMALVPDPLALEALEYARTLLPESATAARARAYGLLANLPPHSLAVESSRALGASALQLARDLGDPSRLLEALVSTFPANAGPDRIDELLARADEVLRLDGPRVSWWSAEAFSARYTALLQRGDGPAARRALEAFGECAHSLRMPEAVWQHDRFRAQTAMVQGDFAGAEARFHELFAQSGSFRTYGLFLYAAQMNALSWERDGKPLATASLTASPDVAWKWAATLPSFRAEKILVLLALDDKDAAIAELGDLAKDGFAGVPLDMNYLYALSRFAVAAVALRQAPAAQHLYDRLRPYAKCNAVNGFMLCLGSVSHFLGILAAFLGRTAEATAHLEEALAMNTRLGHKAQALRTQLALADLLRGGASPGMRQRAASLAEGVVAGARELGVELIP